METDVIHYIALCGYPKAGKTEVQKIISRRYGFVAHDDKRPLRDAVKILYGLTDWHVLTQAGKASFIDTPQGRVTVRKAMGDLGCYLEDKDEFHFPRLALSNCQKHDPKGLFVFASVRQNQAGFLKENGETLVIEVTREGCNATHAFDDYFRDPIDFSIENIRTSDAPEVSLHNLEMRVAEMLDPILMRAPVAA